MSLKLLKAEIKDALHAVEFTRGKGEYRSHYDFKFTDDFSCHLYLGIHGMRTMYDISPQMSLECLPLTARIKEDDLLKDKHITNSFVFVTISQIETVFSFWNSEFSLFGDYDKPYKYNIELLQKALINIAIPSISQFATPKGAFEFLRKSNDERYINYHPFYSSHGERSVEHFLKIYPELA